VGSPFKHRFNAVFQGGPEVFTSKWERWGQLGLTKARAEGGVAWNSKFAKEVWVWGRERNW